MMHEAVLFPDSVTFFPVFRSLDSHFPVAGFRKFEVGEDASGTAAPLWKPEDANVHGSESCMSLGKTELLVRRAVNSVRAMVVLAVVPGADGQALVVRGERLV
jgi:hypothetical protein